MTADKIIEDIIKNPQRWFEWWDRYPLPEDILRELLYKTKEIKDDRKFPNR